ncbi:MAG: thiamine-phosphate diphosphorylase [Elusimicrobia bacterium RIFOXYA2_FULL_39_19]|nr:MAG: thiamine-phosphate diphosphorylase [Elusimicrobia bacterium RIFOXYA2_FULL_39_19]
MNKNKIRGYYFITDSGLSKKGNLSDVKNAVKAGVSVVQYRNKSGSSRELFDEALELKKICAGKALFIINDRIDIALAVNADGVHLGLEDMYYKEARKILGKGKIIGLTVHNIKEALQARRWGADYLGFSPVFATNTKADAGKPAGTKLLAAVKSGVNIPVVAIGGINLSNAGEVVRAGADSLCAISAVITSNDVVKEIKKFQKMF